MINMFKKGYKNRIKTVLVIQLLLLITLIILLTKAFMVDFSLNYIRYIFYITALSSFIAGIEEILLKKGISNYIFNFLLAAFFVILSNFFV